MGKILLIEDDGLLTKDLKKILEDCGYDVITAYSYVSAMDRWKGYKGKFDCIIIDLNINSSNLGDRKSSKYIPICGMAFLDDILEGVYNPENGEDEKETVAKLNHLNKVIIYSGVLKSLKQRKFEFKYYDQLFSILKSETSVAKLINKVREIIKY